MILELHLKDNQVYIIQMQTNRFEQAAQFQWNDR